MAPQKLPPAARLHATLARGLEWVWPAGAAWAYADALSHAPDDAELHFLRAQAAGHAGKWRDAAGALEQATRLEPTNVEYQGALVIAHHQARHDGAVLLALQRLLELRPGQGEIHLLMGAVLRRCGRRVEALRAFRLGVWLAMTPNPRRFLLGEVLLGAEAWRETVVAWQQARRLESADGAALEPAEGRSPLNYHPGLRTAKAARTPPSAGRGRSLRTALLAHWSAARSSCAGLLDRSTRALTLEQRVRALRRAWHKTRPRSAGRPAARGVT
jgi:tetratricopeptide (TPR) repeat protein